MRQRTEQRAAQADANAFLALRLGKVKTLAGGAEGGRQSIACRRRSAPARLAVVSSISSP